MFTKQELTPQKTRKQSAEEVNRAMTRFPLIVGVLGELRSSGVPFPGDDDIRHGLQRAVTAIMVELARIEPAPAGKPTKAEATALGWLHESAAEGLIDADQLERIGQFIERILGSRMSHH